MKLKIFSFFILFSLMCSNAFAYLNTQQTEYYSEKITNTFINVVKASIEKYEWNDLSKKAAAKMYIESEDLRINTKRRIFQVLATEDVNDFFDILTSVKIDNEFKEMIKEFYDYIFINSVKAI